MRRVVYTIEGNIGSGKSTLLQLLLKHIPQIQIEPEPIGSWQHIDAYNILDTFYQQPHRWAYTFQNYVLVTRMKQLTKQLQTPYSPKELLFTERSVVADR